MLNETLLNLTQRLAKVGGWAITYGETKSIYWTQSTFDLFEHQGNPPLSLEEVVQFVAPEYRAESMMMLDRCRREGIPCDIEFEIITSRGTRKWIRLVAECERDANNRVVRVYGAMQDISPQKEQEREKRQLSERLFNTLENMTDAFYLLDREWRILYVNKAADRLVGVNRVDGLGGVIWDEFPNLIDTPLYHGFYASVRDDKPFHYEYYSDLMDNWIELDAYPSPEGLAVYFHSVTEKKILAERVKQSQRLESIGKLTGHVAHDFNNLLTVILGNADMLQEMLSTDDRRYKLATMISGAAVKGSDLTRRLLAFARKQALDPKAVDVNTLVESMRDMLTRTLGINIEIRVHTTMDLKSALVDGHQLEGALLNLCLNARDAMPGGGTLTIETRNTRIIKEVAVMQPELAPGDYVMLAVTDTGTGIHPDHLEQVFEPFFTTKEPGKGTGLGLSSVFGFVKQSNGHVSIYSELGAGTTVKIYLPVSQQEQIASIAVTQPSFGGRESILLVEDDEMVRAIAEEMLVTALGYAVHVAPDGKSALSLLSEGLEPDLMFTDLMMPGMNGNELCDHARKLQPDLKVLFTSGFAENAVLNHAKAEPGFPILPKPYSLSDLAKKIREELDRRP